MESVIENTIKKHCAISGISVQQLSLQIAGNKDYICNAIYTNRHHCVVPKLREIVDFSPDVLAWTEKTIDRAKENSRTAKQKRTATSRPRLGISERVVHRISWARWG